MQILLKKPKKKLVIWLVFFVCAALLIFRFVVPKPGLDARGMAVWGELAFVLTLYVYFNFVGYGLGHYFLRYLALPLLANIELTLLALLLGFGVLSTGIMVLGLAGWLNSVAIFLWLVVSGIFAAREWIEIDTWHAPRLSRPKTPYLIFLQLVCVVSIPLLIVECLSPLWDYDALLYHMEVPRQFFALGKIYFDPEVLRSAYPYLGEMPFLIGIAFDSASFSKLVNFTYAILFVLSSYVFSYRFFGRHSASNSVGIMIGAPAFWTWATWAGVDFAWASYEFWSMYAVSLWLAANKVDSRKWLALAGIMSGFAVGIKYLSIPTFLVVSLIIVWKSSENSRQPIKEVVSNLTIFVISAGLTGAVWYIRNWLEAGNPIYPLIFGGPGWDSLENRVLSDYVYSFGVGKSWLDYLLLPYNVYAYHDQFSTIGLELIHPALWFAFLYPLLLKPFRKFDWVVVYTFLVFVLWTINSQVIRFLVPITAFLAILAGAVIETFPSMLKSLLRIGLMGGFMLFSLVFQLQWLKDGDAWGYVSGRKSAGEFLQSTSYGYRMIQYIHGTIEAGDKVLFLWDGRGYYCDSRCVADDEQSAAIRLAFDSPIPADLAAGLHDKGFTHLLLSKADAVWFITYHDPGGLHRSALNYFEDVFFIACGRLIYNAENMYLFEITCQ